MKSGLGRRFAVAASGAAIFGLLTLTAACGQSEEAPEETTETTTTTTVEETTTEETTTEETTPTEPAPLEPTENAPRIDPGPNPFSPTVIAPPAPTAIPGDN